jgi:UDP-N-acetylmuramate dehydrogenase
MNAEAIFRPQSSMKGFQTAMDLTTGFEKIVRRDEPLAMHTWFQLGGSAEYFAEPSDPDELIALIERCHEEEIPVRLLGRGSNVLVRDEGVPGVVVRLASPEFGRIAVDGQTVTAGGGASLGRSITTAVHRGLAGLEALVGIPGTVGGALFGNAGSHAGDVGQWVGRVTVISQTGEVYGREHDDLEFAYRRSNLDELVILDATFRLEEDDPTELARRMQKYWIVKKANQPMGHQCAGCVFKNPRGASAGELIEEAGLKGTRIGGAVVSNRHANFIVAEPECTSQDVLRLIDLVRGQVHDRLGIELERELEIW